MVNSSQINLHKFCLKIINIILTSMKIIIIFLSLAFFTSVYALTQTVSMTQSLGNNSFISSTMNLLWPISNSSTTSNYPFSSTFGPRLQASNNFSYDFHRGIDIPKPNRTKLYAVGSGLIFRSRLSDSGDRYIALRLQHPASIQNITGFKYVYAIYRHLNESLVSEGSNVTAGDHIAYSGEDADSGFDHLHFDMAVGQTYQTNNTHPLVYFKYNNTETPNISKPNTAYFNPITRKLNITVTVSSSELDLMGVSVIGTINNNFQNLTADFDFPEMNHKTINKTLLDNKSQRLSNNVVVTIYPESHNMNNLKCVIHFQFNFEEVILSSTIINQYQFNITAYDARDGFERISVTGQ